MKLAFIDSMNWEYDAKTPHERPLGGSQSALCYLTVALAGRGHSVTLYTGTIRPRVYQGVQCGSYKSLTRESLAGCDAVIVSNGPAEICFVLRPHLPAGCRLILWTQCAHDQPAMSELKRPEVRAGWDVIVCVSQWHAAEMLRHFGLDANRVTVLGNAIGPAFENLFADAAALVGAKSAMPVLAYTSTPYRGLNLLLSLFPEVHRRDERVRLRVYSSMKVYGQDESNDPNVGLYALSRSMPGVEYFGSVPQPQLAESLKSAWILSYPNTFAETSCIAVMEAMAAGLLVVTSEFGALPETTMGMGSLVPVPKNPQGVADFISAYTDRLRDSLQEINRDPQQFWSARWEQVRRINTLCSWPVRALEWERFLLQLHQG